MSFQGHQTCISLKAGADLSAAQFKAVSVDANGEAVVAGAGDFAVGVLQNNPGLGELATVQIAGISKMKADAAVAAGARIASSADGEAATSTVATDNSIGIALAAAAGAGEIIPVLVVHAGASVAN